MKIILVRHGESEANVSTESTTTRPDRQPYRARQAAGGGGGGAPARRSVHPCLCFAISPRATDYRDPVAAARVEPQVDARLNERRPAWTACTVDTFNDLGPRRLPAHQATARANRSSNRWSACAASWMRSHSRHPDGVVLAVSHENPILAALALSSEEPEKAARGSLANCEWVELQR